MNSYPNVQAAWEDQQRPNITGRQKSRREAALFFGLICAIAALGGLLTLANQAQEEGSPPPGSTNALAAVTPSHIEPDKVKDPRTEARPIAGNDGALYGVKVPSKVPKEKATLGAALSDAPQAQAPSISPVEEAAPAAKVVGAEAAPEARAVIDVKVPAAKKVGALVGAREVPADTAHVANAAPTDAGSAKHVPQHLVYPGHYRGSQVQPWVASKVALQTLVEQLDGCAEASITGYTDSVGNAAKNKTLGRRRAKWVVKKLKSLGVKTTFQVRSGGEKNPLGSNKTEASRAKNRRVEMKCK